MNLNASSWSTAYMYFVFLFTLIGSADFFGLNEYTTRLARPKENKDEKPDPFEAIPDADVDQISDPTWDMYVSNHTHSDHI